MFFSLFENIGKLFLHFLKHLGQRFLFFLNVLWAGFRPPWYGRQIIEQIVDIGYFSIPVVAFTAFFSGMVLALQSYTGFARFSSEDAIATVVVLSMTRELGPVLAGLMVAGRIGASQAAEIGTMRVTEQIDAFQTLSVNPLKYIVFPRILAGFLCLPFLVLLADVLGVLGGYLISVYKLNFNEADYIEKTLKFLNKDDIVSGLIKAACFGVILTFMGCFQGYQTKGGAQGVGRSTTRAVVSGSILILFANYLLTSILFER
jgi:phospholipid/cholesterol/gamma-HCH transport system permease protein